jgi:hypothetical protein
MSLADPGIAVVAALLAPQRRFLGSDAGLVRDRTGWGFCVLKRTLGWAGTWIAITALLGACHDPGPGAAPTTPAQTASGGPGSATLSWEAPTTNTNGTALTDLAGYRIYYGSSTEHLDHTVHISTVGLQTYVIEGLEPGNWYFAVMALASDGTESKLSDIVLKTIT